MSDQTWASKRVVMMKSGFDTLNFRVAIMLDAITDADGVPKSRSGWSKIWGCV